MSRAVYCGLIKIKSAFRARLNLIVNAPRAGRYIFSDDDDDAHKKVSDREN